MGKSNRILILGISLLFIVLLSLFYIITQSYQKSNLQEIPKNNPAITPTTLLVTSSPVETHDKVETPSVQGGEKILDQLPIWAPDVRWQLPKAGIESVNSNPISGILRTGEGISQLNLVPDIPPIIHDQLLKQGWEEKYPAQAPGSSFYQFTKIDSGKQRVLYLYYTTRAAVISGPGEPIKFEKCPCPYELKVFYSDQF